MFNHSFTKKTLYISLLFISMLACSKSEESEPAPQKVSSKALAIDPSVTYQTIAGFGAANQMWGSTFPDATDMKSAFGTEESDLGLSIFRIRVASNPDEWPLIVNVTKEAKKYGAKIMASPWSPPPALKSNASDVGGHLLDDNYEAYVNHLNEFIAFMVTNDVSVDVISIQNEPDIQVSYESCDWSSTQISNFLKDYGHLIEGPKVAAPESFNFNQSFTNAILNNNEAAANLDIVAGHIYGGGLAPFPTAEQKGKEVWMTEYLMNQNASSNWSQISADVIWDETLQMLNTVHQAMENNWNAYIWWYLKRYYSFIGDGTQGTTSGEILKRGYAFSHFSKFVRPGYVRVKTEFPQQYDALISAYRGEGKTIIILINPGTAAVSNISLAIAGETPASATVYSTTSSVNVEKTIVEPQDGHLIVSLGSKSVLTVVVED